MEKTVQGSSWITPFKHHHLFGIVETRLLQLKRRIRDYQTEKPQHDLGGVRLRVRDALCGTGSNFIEGEHLDGSPFAILGAFDKLMPGLYHAERKAGPIAWKDFPVQFYFSDVRLESTKALGTMIREKMTLGQGMFGIQDINDIMHLQTKEASAAIARDMLWVKKATNQRLIIIIDPNGPKDLPYEIVKTILNGPFRDDVDIILNVSATSIKRLHGNKVAGSCVKEWIGRFDKIFIDGMQANSESWIREPMTSDKFQWTILCYWGGFAPRGAWEKRGFVKLGSDRGKRAVEHYSEKKIA